MKSTISETENGFIIIITAETATEANRMARIGLNQDKDKVDISINVLSNGAFEAYIDVTKNKICVEDCASIEVPI